MKTRLALFAALIAFLAPGCTSTPSTSASVDAAQLARLSAVANVLAQSGASAVLAKNPTHRAELLAIAEAIEQAAALPDAPAPSNLINLLSGSAAKLGGSYGIIASLGLQAGVAIYEQVYAANVSSALDKQPAYRAILVALAGGIRSAVNGSPASSVPPPLLTPDDYVFQPQR